MKGTEKQIAFATKLIEKMNEQFDLIVSDCEKAMPEQTKTWIKCKKGYNEIMDQSHAGCVIDLLKNINETSCQEYYKSLFTRLKYGTDVMCERIRKEVYDK